MDATKTESTTYTLPTDELIELLETTPLSEVSYRLRVKPDRRVRQDPAPVPDRRRS
jgi:hypothetical protein